MYLLLNFYLQSLQLFVFKLGDQDLKGIDGPCKTKYDCENKLVCDDIKKQCTSKLTTVINLEKATTQTNKQTHQ